MHSPQLITWLDASIGSGGGGLQAPTRNVNNISIDPLDENYFASAGSSGDPSVTVWDKRWISPSSSNSNGAVLNFSPAVNVSATTTIWSLRYSGQRRGRLAICANTGEIRVIDMLESKTLPVHNSEYLPMNPYGGSPWHANRYVSRVRDVQRPWHQAGEDSKDSSRAIAFDWAGEEISKSEQAMLILQPSRKVEVVHVPLADTHAEVTSRQELGTLREEIRVTEPRSYIASAKPMAPYEQQNRASTAEDPEIIDHEPEDNSLDDGDEIARRRSRDASYVGKLLAPATMSRERCRLGYLFDCHKNIGIVAGNWQLERLWEIVNRFKEQAADKAMIHGGVDLSYVGVSGLWSEVAGNMERRRSPSRRTKVSDAIIGLISDRDIPPFEGERTNFPEHRQLCLAACGWKFTVDTLEAECQELIDRGLYYTAIVQAVLHDYKHIALNMLRTLIRSKTVPNIGLGALLASDKINEEQREMCLWMAADTEDPALKALLTFLTTGDWRDVMKTNYLHLGYRVALALRYLNDTELSGFLQTETARAVRNGDPEGTLLTGLGEEAMDLFQTYIAKTNDLQTAVLATAFTNPRYVDDLRFDMWKEVYLEQMQAWRAFSERTKFTVQHAHKARTADGKTLLEPPPAPVTLKCNHCQGALARRTPATSQATANGTKQHGPLAHAGTVCPRCGRSMPRCALCQLWLGTPDPSKSPAADSLAKSKDLMAKFLSFCVSCGHGFHADHAKTWFGKHSICPVPDCKCMCGLA